MLRSSPPTGPVRLLKKVRSTTPESHRLAQWLVAFPATGAASQNQTAGSFSRKLRMIRRILIAGIERSASPIPMLVVGSTATCPGGQTSQSRFRDEQKQTTKYRFAAATCRCWPLLKRCMKDAPKGHGRTVCKSDYQAEHRRARQKTKTPQYATIRREHLKDQANGAFAVRAGGSRSQPGMSRGRRCCAGREDQAISVGATAQTHIVT